MKKIALDLDGVVFDSENLFRVYTEIYDIVINFQSIFKHDITEALYILEFSNIMIEYLMPDEFKLPFKIYDEDKLMAYVKVFGNTYKKGR